MHPLKNSLISPISPREARGTHDYDLIVGSMTRSAIPVVVAACASRWPEDFKAAAKVLGPLEMVILAKFVEANLAMLTDPQFDPIMAISRELGAYEVAECIERDRVGREIDVSRTLKELVESVRRLDADAAKALWAGLSFAQWADHKLDEARLCRWLEPTLLSNYEA